MSALSYDEIRGIERTRKSELIAEIERWAREHCRHWVIGGPWQWSKDELVSAVTRIRTGGQP